MNGKLKDLGNDISMHGYIYIYIYIYFKCQSYLNKVVFKKKK